MEKIKMDLTKKEEEFYDIIPNVQADNDKRYSAKETLTPATPCWGKSIP